MRLALVVASAAVLYGCAAPAQKETNPDSSTPSSVANDGASLRTAQLQLEPKYTLQRPNGERLSGLVRQSGHFSSPYLIAASESGTLHRFQASTGTYHDEVGGDRQGDDLNFKPQALTTIGKELWLADSAGRRLQQFHGFDPRYVETLESDILKSPLSLLFVSGVDGGRILFVLDRDGDQLSLHRFETRVTSATAPNQPDRISLGDVRTIDIGPLAGVPSLVNDFDSSRLVLVNGSQVLAWDYDLSALPNPLAAVTLQNSTVGAGLLSCTGSLDKGYWFIVESSSASTIIRFIGYEKGELRGNVELRGIDWSSGILFDRSNMALFPRGAIFSIEGGQRIKGYAWDEITSTIGQRAHCF